VIDAADAVAFHPAGGELGTSMRAAKSHDVGRSSLSTVECETFAHDFDWLGVAGPKFFCTMYRMPKPAHESPGKTARSGRDEILVAKFFTVNVALAFA
jgi:hypothetical protein